MQKLPTLLNSALLESDFERCCWNRWLIGRNMLLVGASRFGLIVRITLFKYKLYIFHCLHAFNIAFFHHASRASFFLSDQEKRRFCLNCVKPLKSPSPEKPGLVNIVCSRQSGFPRGNIPFKTDGHNWARSTKSTAVRRGIQIVRLVRGSGNMISQHDCSRGLAMHKRDTGFRPKESPWKIFVGGWQRRRIRETIVGKSTF